MHVSSRYTTPDSSFGSALPRDFNSGRCIMHWQPSSYTLRHADGCVLKNGRRQKAPSENCMLWKTDLKGIVVGCQQG